MSTASRVSGKRERERARRGKRTSEQAFVGSSAVRRSTKAQKRRKEWATRRAHRRGPRRELGKWRRSTGRQARTDWKRVRRSARRERPRPPVCIPLVFPNTKPDSDRGRRASKGLHSRSLASHTASPASLASSPDSHHHLVHPSQLSLSHTASSTSHLSPPSRTQ